MKKKFYFLLAGFILLFLLLFSAIYFFSHNKNKRTGVLEMSVIIRGRQNGYWTSIKQGMDKAAYDMNVDISFIPLLKENDADEQLSAVKREAANSTGAIIIAPVELGLFEDIKALETKTVIVGLESAPDNFSGKNKSFVFTHNYEMGYEIGTIVAEDYRQGEKLVLVRTVPVDACTLEREKGFLEALRESDVSVEYWDIQANTVGSAEQIKSKIVLEGADIMAALSAGDILNAAHGVSSIYECNIPIYGIGSTNEIISYMEKGIVRTVAAYSGFNLGYLSIKAAVDIIEGTKTQDAIILDHAVVTSENLYTDSNQRLLFPFVK